MESRDGAVEVRLEALRAAARVAQPHDDVGNLLIHTEWIYQFLTTGKSPATDSVIAGSGVVGN